MDTSIDDLDLNYIRILNRTIDNFKIYCDISNTLKKIPETIQINDCHLNVFEKYQDTCLRTKADCLVKIESLYAHLYQSELFRDIPFDTFLKVSTVDSIPNLSTSQTVDIGRILYEEEVKICKESFFTIFDGFLKESIFEYGYSNPAEVFIEDMLGKNGPLSREWINEYFLKYYQFPETTSKVLRIISHLPYEMIYPQGPTMCLAGLLHKSTEVNEAAIRAIENWEAPDNLILLKNIKVKEKWLDDYLKQVICDLEDVKCHILLEK